MQHPHRQQRRCGGRLRENSAHARELLMHPADVADWPGRVRAAAAATEAVRAAARNGAAIRLDAGPDGRGLLVTVSFG